MADNVPASPYDASIETAILMRTSRPALPPSLPDNIESAIMGLEVGASLEDQEQVRKLWADYKLSQVHNSEENGDDTLVTT